MIKRVLIVGGYGNFGSYIARALAPEPNIQLVIAGRTAVKAERFTASLSASNAPEACVLDISKDLSPRLAEIAPDIVIHTSGPFQKQDHSVAKACILQGCHYIDLADARDFVCSIGRLNTEAQKQRVLIVSGASSVPCLSSSLIDYYLPHFSNLERVDYGISTAQKTNRGHATTAAILSYVGKPFETIAGGAIRIVHGWQSLHRKKFLGLGQRLLGNCDIPDLSLFPARYPSLKTLRFYAGLEIPILHIGLWGLSWLARFNLLPPLDRFASALLRTSFFFDRFGSDKSGFYMRLSGTGHAGEQKAVSFDLCASSGHGPFIPCMPAILIARQLAAETRTTTGAMPCVGLITRNEYLKALEHLDIEWQASE